MTVDVREGSLEDAVLVTQQIPEFEHPPSQEQYEARLSDVENHILIAYDGKIPVGFWISYKAKDNFLYLWRNGVVLDHREQGISAQMEAEQEVWAKTHGYSKIRVQTKLKHRDLQALCRELGFNLIEIIPMPHSVREDKVIYEKEL